MKKKVLSMLLVMNILGIALSGCGDSASDDAAKASDNSQKEETTEQSKATTETETETSTETVTVKVLMSAGWTEDAIDAIRPQLKEKGIELDIEAYDSATYEGKQRLACSSKGGEYDVVFLPGNVVNTYANAGALIPMNDVVEDMGFTDDDYYDSVRKFTKVGDDWYVVPFSAECMVYFYRTDLISEDQVPTTIDEMYELGKSLTNGDTYGCASPAQSGEAACSMWSYFLWSYGGDYFDENWYPTLNTPEAVEAAEMFAKSPTYHQLPVFDLDPIQYPLNADILMGEIHSCNVRNKFGVSPCFLLYYFGGITLVNAYHYPFHKGENLFIGNSLQGRFSDRFIKKSSFGVIVIDSFRLIGKQNTPTVGNLCSFMCPKLIQRI